MELSSNVDYNNWAKQSVCAIDLDKKTMYVLNIDPRHLLHGFVILILQLTKKQCIGKLVQQGWLSE